MLFSLLNNAGPLIHCAQHSRDSAIGDMLRDKTSICSKKRDSSEGTLLARTPSKHGPGFLRTSAAKNLNRDVNQTLIIDEESLNLSQYPLQQTVHQRHQDR